MKNAFVANLWIENVNYSHNESTKTVFNHISKHQEESWKYDEQRSIFDELWDGNIAKVDLECLIILYLLNRN